MIGFAPRPVMMLTGTRDYFPIAGGHAHRIAALEAARNAHQPHGQQAAAAAQGQRRTFRLIVNLMNPGSARFTTGPATTTIYVSNPLHPGEQDGERTESIEIKATPPPR